MAKEVRKTIGIFVNGKEVENNLKSIKAAIAKVSNELNKMTVGTEEYNAHAAKLSQLKKIYDDYKEELKDVREELEAGEKAHDDFIIKAGAIASVVNTGFTALQKFVSSTQEYVEAYASIDDAMSGVMKTTGMTREEVEALNESLKGIDTRTSQEELLTISQIGGRMGLAKDQILDFTKAVDLANVALGDSFSGGAEEISSVLGKISLAFKETRDANIGDSLTRIGSAINEVGGKANATEPNIAAFVQRVGSMPEAFRPSVQEAVALGAAFEESSIDAEVASRAFGILMNKASTDVEGFAEVMGQPVEAVRELINTNPTQFFTEFAKSLQGMDATQIGETLKGLKLNADGVVKIVGAMSGSYDRFNEILQVSNSAFSENTSLMNEFNNVNNNSAAQLEKAKKQMQEARVELGEKLIPILTSIFKILGSTSAWITKHIALVASLATGIGAIVSILGVAYLKEKAMMAMEKAKIAVETIHKSLIASKTVAVQSYNLVLAKQTKNTVAQVAAQEALNTAMKSTPWGLIAIGIASVISALVYFTKHTRESKAAMDEFNSTVAKEQSEVDYLFNKLKNAEEGTDDYKEALQQLIDKYPEVMAKHIDEKGRLDDINQAYQDIIQSIQTKTALDMKEKQITAANEKAINAQTKAYKDLKTVLVKNGKTEDVADSLVKDVQNRLGRGDSKNDVLSYLKSQGVDLNRERFTGEGLWTSNVTDAIGKVIDSEKELLKTTKDIEKTYDPFIQKTKSDLEEMEDQLRQLKTQQSAAESSDDKKNIQKQIDLLKEKIRLKKEAGKPNADGSGGSESGDGNNGGSSSSKKDPVADFEKKLKDFRQRQQAASLEGWEKTKQGIINSYQEMIDEANKLNRTQTAKDLETERDDAIKTAGQKYLQKYTLMLTNMKQETEKLLAENDGEDMSELQKAVIGTQKQWDDKISAVKANIAIVGDILQQISEDDPMRDLMTNVYDGMLADMARLEAGKAQATANTIQKYAKETSTFIQNERKEMERAQMTELEREKAEINDRYQVEIDRLTEVINKKKTDPIFADSEEELNDLVVANMDEIDQLEEKLKNLIALRDQLLDNAGKKKKSNNNVWSDLLDIDWSKFKDNWQENLQTMTAALQEFASTAFDIFNSINQIQSNRENAAFDEWCDIQDEKAEALQRQLDDGIISQKYYDAQMDKMQKEKEAKEKKIQHDQFERDKKANIIQATISGALAMVNALTVQPWVAAVVAAALTAATTAAQIAVIASQANPYAKGGFIRKEQIALMGEEGEEWVASHKLLTDKKTAPVINALESYQRGDRQALDALTSVPEPNWGKVSQSSKMISRTFAPQSQNVTNVYNTNNSNNTTTTNHNGDNSELLKEIRQMNAYLKDPKNRQAYISRRMQLEFDRQENEIKEMSRL